MAGTKQIGEAIVAAIRSIEANGDRISKSELVHAIDVSMRGVLPKWNSSIFLRMCNVASIQEQIEQVDMEVARDRIYYDDYRLFTRDAIREWVVQTQPRQTAPAPRVEVIVCEMCQIGFLNTDIRICPHCSNPYCLGCLAEHDRERS